MEKIRSNMKNLNLSFIKAFLLLTIISFSSEINAQVGLGNLAPNDGTALDVQSSTKGILIPNVSISNLRTIDPIVEDTSAEEGLLVYNTNIITGKGFYYWDGANWILLGVNVFGGNDWKLTGNSGTNISTNYLGTIDDQDYVFRTNGVERMRLTYENATGDARLGVGTDNPNETLDVNGDVEMGGGPNRYDNEGENFYIQPTRNTWYVSVRNDADVNDSEFFIADDAIDRYKAIAIEPLTNYISIGNDGNNLEVLDIVHVLKDQSQTTTVRIDNDNSSVANTAHTSFELWQGATEKAFFRHKNVEDILEIGHASTSGEINFYLGSNHIMNFSKPTSTAEVLVTNDLDVDGDFTKGGGTFKIDHPLYPEDKYLYHSFVESPDMMNIYNGITTTDQNGIATVTLPSYFNALNKQFQYLFTPIGAFSRVMVTEEISENTFTIQSEIPNVKVSWQVTGIRQDPYANKNRVIPEVDKEPKDVSDSSTNSSSN